MAKCVRFDSYEDAVEFRDAHHADSAVIRDCSGEWLVMWVD